MTTGSSTKGTLTGNFANHYRVRTWVGGDRIPSVPEYTYERIDYVKTAYRTRKGKRYVIQYHTSRMKKFRKPYPRRYYKDRPNEYTSNFTERNDGYVEYYHNNTWNLISTPDAGLGGIADVTSNWTSNDDIILLGRLRKKVASTDFNAGVFLGESAQALGMISNAATRIAKAYLFSRKGNFVAAARALTDVRTAKNLKNEAKHPVANNWLELQYGWLPLLKDAEEGAIFLANRLGVPLSWNFRVRYKRPLDFSTSAPALNSWSLVNRSEEAAQIVAELKEQDSVQLSGLTDPLSVAWELLPYSFVADWFIPIGNYLSARGLSQALAGEFVTTRTKRIECKGLNITHPLYTFRGDTSDVYAKYITVDRKISKSLSVPFPSVKGLGSVPSWRRAANAVALLLQKR